MSFALEFYSLSWDTLKTALTQRKPEFLRAIEDEQWSRLLEDTDLGQPTHHLFSDETNPLSGNAAPAIADGLDEIAEAMAQKVPARHDPPEISDKAALVFAAMVRQLGKRVGAIRHDGSVVRDEDGELPMDFHAMFLDGVAGSCFRDHTLGESLSARPLLGLYHLDFLSWGGLTQQELSELLPKYALPSDEEKQDEEWQAIATYAEGWLTDLVNSLRGAAAAKADLVTLYLTVQEHFGSFRDELGDEMREDFSFFGKLRSLFGK
jgi:hypothetical protein